MLGAASAAKEPLPMGVLKPKTAPKLKPLRETKAQRGSVLKAIQDIQRMTPEAICLEFERMVQHTERHFGRKQSTPCSDVAAQLMRCLRQQQQQSSKCFKAMDDYRLCVAIATQQRIDVMADEPAPEPPHLAIAQPLPMPPPAAPAAKERRRFWYKPWTWFRQQ
ncbi:CG9101 [Drosophila busckii]|uniref:CG9101 n=2 Tax=Drosophila busckii TaxID=30019 RepID=A0A0M4ETE1_DROBS|nr:CG9101 [Drosophila busckii]